MRGSSYVWSDWTPAKEKAALKKEDDAVLRRARIQNGADPAYKNGHPKDAEKGRITK